MTESLKATKCWHSAIKCAKIMQLEYSNMMQQRQKKKKVSLFIVKE